MHTPHGFSRLVNFSDAVVAIAITVLILPLVDTVVDFDGSAAEFILANLFQIFMFVLSFAVIGNFWLVHHRIYERAKDYNGPLLWANLLWLLSIVFLPFPTELLAISGSDDKVTNAIYIGTMIVTCGAGLLQQGILIRNAELQTEEARGTLRLLPFVSATVIMIIAFILAVFTPVGLWGLLLHFLTRPGEKLFDRVRRRRT